MTDDAVDSELAAAVDDAMWQALADLAPVLRAGAALPPPPAVEDVLRGICAALAADPLTWTNNP